MKIISDHIQRRCYSEIGYLHEENLYSDNFLSSALRDISEIVIIGLVDSLLDHLYDEKK